MNEATEYLRKRFPEAESDVVYRGVPIKEFERDDLLRIIQYLGSKLPDLNKLGSE